MKAAFQGTGTQVAFAALVLFRVRPDWAWAGEIPWWTMLVITLVTVWSFADYLLGNWPMLRDAWSVKGKAS